MGVHGFGLELRVELTADEPGVVKNLDDFDQGVFRVPAAEDPVDGFKRERPIPSPRHAPVFSID